MTEFYVPGELEGKYPALRVLDKRTKLCVGYDIWRGSSDPIRVSPIPINNWMPSASSEGAVECREDAIKICFADFAYETARMSRLVTERLDYASLAGVGR